VKHVERFFVHDKLVLVHETLMWFKDIPLALFFRLPGEVVGELMDCHPQHIGQAVGLALAHVPREQRVVALQELQEGGGGGDVALDSGTFHLELHLNWERIVGLVPLPPLCELYMTIPAQLFEGPLSEPSVLSCGSIQAFATSRVELKAARKGYLSSKERR